MTYTVRPMHAYDASRITAIMDEMRMLGAPTIRAVRDGSHWDAIEGVHRLEAAHRLGMAPVMVEVSESDLIADLDLDWQDAGPGSTVADLLALERPDMAYRFAP